MALSYKPPWARRAVVAGAQSTANGALAFRVFLLLQLTSLTRTLGMAYLGEWFNVVGRVANAASWVFLGLAVLSYCRGGPSTIRGVRFWAGSVLGLCGALLLYGTEGRGYLFSEAVQDFASYWMLVCCVLLGSQPRFWREAKGALFWALMLGAFANAVAMLDYGSLFETNSYFARVARDSLSYRTQSAVAFITLLVPLLLFFRARPQFAIALVWCSSLAQQVLFQKRHGTVYLMALATILLLQLVLLPQGDEARVLRPRVLKTGTLAGLLAVALAAGAAPEMLPAQFGSLLERFRGQGVGQAAEYSSGSLPFFSIENERYQIVEDCFRSFTLEEWVFGRGMGGAFEWTGFGVELLDSSRRGQIDAAYLLTDTGYYGRRVLEVGLAMPLLKGGVILWITVMTGVGMGLARWRLLWSEPFSRACLLVVGLTMVSSAIAGNFNQSDGLQLACWSLALGWCLSRFSPSCPWEGPVTSPRTSDRPTSPRRWQARPPAPERGYSARRHDRIRSGAGPIGSPRK